MQSETMREDPLSYVFDFWRFDAHEGLRYTVLDDSIFLNSMYTNQLVDLIV